MHVGVPLREKHVKVIGVSIKVQNAIEITCLLTFYV